MYNLNKLVSVAVSAIISLIDATEYDTRTEIYDVGKIVGYKNKKILIADECLIRIFSVVPEDNNKNGAGTCEITTTAKDGSETGSMKIHVEVDDHGYGFRSPTISVETDAIIDNISDSTEAIIAALKTIIK